jgi:hypothetical protein
MNPIKTRSGRISKPPERFSPVEEITDDFSDDEYDGDDIDSDEDIEEDESEEESDDEEDADENGNLKDFVVDDEDEEA